MNYNTSMGKKVNRRTVMRQAADKQTDYEFTFTDAYTICRKLSYKTVLSTVNSIYCGEDGFIALRFPFMAQETHFSVYFISAVSPTKIDTINKSSLKL